MSRVSPHTKSNDCDDRRRKVWNNKGRRRRVLTRHYRRHAAAADQCVSRGLCRDMNAGESYKVLVLGDSNVGKTCLMHRFCDETYYDTYISTIGVDYKQKIIQLDEKPVKLQIWDTAGQERFRTLTTAYYRGAMGILLVYDVTNLDSFDHLTYWLKNIQENASPDVIKVLAGNKCDNETVRAVDKADGEKIAECYDMPFFEVSCKMDVNVEEAFQALAKMIKERSQYSGAFGLRDETPREKCSPLFEKAFAESTRKCSSC